MAHTPSTSSPAQANADTLSISNLDLPSGILAPYVFSDRKLQPAIVSLSLELIHGVISAASTDALDQNTIHYGNLAKAVRDKRPEGQTLLELLDWVEGKVDEMAERKDGGGRVGRCVVSVELGKASMYGTGVRIVSVREKARVERTVRVAFEGVRVMVLIGVNSIERTARQPLDVELEVRCTGDEVLRRDVEAFGLEREMVEIIEPTTFETLESLGEHVVKHLQPKIQEALPSCQGMTLTMRKPKAIAFAEAPALSLMRAFSQTAGGADGIKTIARSGDGRLNLIKPYV